MSVLIKKCKGYQIRQSKNDLWSRNFIVLDSFSQCVFQDDTLQQCINFVDKQVSKKPRKTTKKAV